MQGWAAVRTGDGSWTLRHPGHGQCCGSLAGAWQEALERYAIPCRLRELGLARGRGAVRVLDVGTGTGLNLAAARARLAGTGAHLDALTLEADPDVLRASEDLPAGSEEAAAGLTELRAALSAAARGPSPTIRLGATCTAAAAEVRLLLGDARRTLDELAPTDTFDAVFLDPFSPGVDPELWEPAFLARIATHMASWAVLSTYSSAIRVRRGLAAAGLAVGAGPRVGTKASGTLASWGAGLPPLAGREQRRIAPGAPSPPGDRMQA